MAGTRIAATRPPAAGGSPSSWEGRTLGSLLVDGARSLPDGVAVVDGDVTLTYAELDRAVAAAATGLAGLGVGRGDVVLVDLPNWWEAIVAFHAAARLGAVVNPVIPIYRRAELEFIVAQARPAAIVLPGRFGRVDYLELFQSIGAGGVTGPVPPALVVVRPDGPVPAGVTSFDALLATEAGAPAASDDDVTSTDIALLLYTSGTTADPKGVLHTHDTLVYECRSIETWFELGPDDHVFMGSPLTHITGFLYGYILPALGARTVALLDVWDPAAAADLIERTGCGFTVGATPFLRDLADEHRRRGRPSSLRHFACGGADVPPALVRRATDDLGADVGRAYGSSEFPTATASRPRDPADRKADTDGRPIGPVDVRIDDPVDGVGELLVRGPELFAGYLDPALNAGSFTDDGYFRTGDLASIDADGFVTIRGRLKDIIIRNGENISAREVEDLLFTHPKVADVAVVAVPDERTGERACAFVVPSADAGAGDGIELADLIEHLERTGIARQKLPEQLELIDVLPRTASGKVQKFLLRQRVGRPGTG